MDEKEYIERGAGEQDMTELKKLIELIKPYMSGLACGDESGACELTNCRDCRARNCANDLLANGVIVPPVALGSRQKVYVPVDGTTVVYETKVYGIGVDEDGDMVINPHEYPEDAFGISGYNIGKTVFLSREDAEKALKEREDR